MMISGPKFAEGRHAFRRTVETSAYRGGKTEIQEELTPSLDTPPSPSLSQVVDSRSCLIEPRLTISFLGCKIDGTGTAGVRFAFVVALVVCGMVGLNTLAHWRV